MGNRGPYVARNDFWSGPRNILKSACKKYKYFRIFQKHG